MTAGPAAPSGLPPPASPHPGPEPPARRAEAAPPDRAEEPESGSGPTGAIAAGAVAAAMTAEAIVFAAGLLAASKGNGGLPSALTNWDAGSFLYLIEHGYPNRPDFYDAFWPGYPLLAQPLRWLGVGALGAALAVSAASLVLAAGWTGAWLRDERGDEVAAFGMLALALWPFAVFAVVPYSDGPFWAATAACVYYARRGQFGRAAVAAVVGSSMRLPGELLWLVVGLEAALRRDWRSLGWLAAAPLAVGTYALYLWRRTGDALAFAHAESLPSFGLNLVGPWTGLSTTWDAARGAGDTAFVYAVSLWVTVLVLAVLAAAAAWRLAPASLLVYGVASLALALSSDNWRSVARYEVGLFPIGLLVLSRLPVRWRPHWLGLSAACFALAAFRFASGDWIG